MITHTRKTIRVSGIVQGVGLRPFVCNRARRLNLSGWIKNDSAGVTIEIQGAVRQVQRFIDSFHEQLPPLARVDSMEVAAIPLKIDSGFVILESLIRDGQSTPVSPDISICEDCLEELNDPNDRRYRYPFINCTNCGPRYTILKDIPYDRAKTTMTSFPMCPACFQEYQNPVDRRFHAQPNACHDCGPQIWFVSDANRESDFHTYRDTELPRGDAAVKAFQSAMQLGQIVAVKGIGGFHLACDATNDDTISRLRKRKGRIDKPFAVMVRDLQTCESLAFVNEQERMMLESKERPIVLLRKKVGQTLSAKVAPGIDLLGVMFPYSPLHWLLLQSGPPLLITSGNLSDEPIVCDNIEARHRLSKIADQFLLHDRDIHVACDDSVVRCVNDNMLPIRRSRGFAPTPVKLHHSSPSVLAIGGEIKATFCATKQDNAYISQHIGDMANLETLDAMRRNIEHFLRLFRIQPAAMAADLHPDYLSTSLAKQLSDSMCIPLVQVQHHHAHVVSLIGEHELPTDRPIIGCCFDGTGFGTDAAVWGGEFLIADAYDFDRFAKLKYIGLPGGDASIRRPYRIALAHLFAANHPWKESLPSVQACDEKELVILQQQLQRRFHCADTSSVGRLFDAVASLIGIRQEANYEAQAAMEMESLAEQAIDDATVSSKRYPFKLQGTTPIEIDPAELLGEICRDVIAGERPEAMAASFHQSVKQMVVDVCIAARQVSGINVVGLTGGVFQNALLLRLVKTHLQDCEFEVLTHQQIPANDGGISLGQALIAAAAIAPRTTKAD